MSSTNEPDYAWEVATLFPTQGNWSESDYLALTDSTNRLVEFTDGQVEFLAMPTELHQAILEFLFDAIRAFVKAGELGQVRFAPLRVRIGEGRFRDPDIVFLKKENFGQRANRYWTGADLVVEIVSDDATSRVRDYEHKTIDYARAGICGYWVVDPQERRVRVLQLVDGAYLTHGDFFPGEQADSALLAGLSIDVRDVFAAGDEAMKFGE